MSAEDQLSLGSAAAEFASTDLDFKEKRLYHQIHPLKLATDIGVVPPVLYLLWVHRALPAVLIAFLPPILVSAAMMKWTPDLEWLKNSRAGHYLKQNMTPVVETFRLLSLVPMAYGAWVHGFRYILIGFVILMLAWCNGLIWRSKSGLLHDPASGQ